MSTAIEASAWPGERLHAALAALARASGLGKMGVEAPTAPEASVLADAAATGLWLERAAARMGLEAEPVECSYNDTPRMVRDSGPALLRIRTNAGEPSFLALLGGKARYVSVLGPDAIRRRVAVSKLCASLRESLEAPVAESVDTMLEFARVSPRRRAFARQAILDERLGAKRVAGVCLMLRRPTAAPLLVQLADEGVLRHLATFVGANVLQYGLLVASWWMLGRSVLDGRFDPGWLGAWAILLLSQVPLGLIARRAEGNAAVDGGALLKRKLMMGALNLTPEEMRAEGMGNHLARVYESEAVERLVLSGGLAVIVSAIELMASIVVLALGGAMVPLALLVVWTVAALAWTWRYLRARRTWTDDRLAMTNDLVERMVGHRTRLAQEPHDRWHEGEEGALDRYLASSRSMDGRAVHFATFVPRGWLLLGILGLTPLLLAGVPSVDGLAVALGGVVLAYRGFHRLVGGLASAAGAKVASERLAALFRAGARVEPPGSPRVTSEASTGPAPKEDAADAALVHASNVTFRYRDRGPAVLRNCDLRIQAQDRVLIEGPSGGGKSTLGLLLAGVRAPESGVILLGGCDRSTLGFTEWRRHVVTVPQFHENLVLSATLAFNLLMGHDWPARDADFQEAETVCHELGLGPLLERMPSGLLQMVGETGWQLSHGERSRVFMARALLQRPDLMVLDESFAALDPVTLRTALDCVLRRARAVVVIAHP